MAEIKLDAVSDAAEPDFSAVARGLQEIMRTQIDALGATTDWRACVADIVSQFRRPSAAELYSSMAAQLREDLNITQAAWSAPEFNPRPAPPRPLQVLYDPDCFGERRHLPFAEQWDQDLGRGISECACVGDELVFYVTVTGAPRQFLVVCRDCLQPTNHPCPDWYAGLPAVDGGGETSAPRSPPLRIVRDDDPDTES